MYSQPVVPLDSSGGIVILSGYPSTFDMLFNIDTEELN